MNKETEYQFWTLDHMNENLVKQADFYGYSRVEKTAIRLMLVDENWNPLTDFDGCSVIEDRHHPFLPCFKHDYNWMVRGGGIKYDREFKNDLIRCGISKTRANLMFLGVRVAWLFYYQFKQK